MPGGSSVGKISLDLGLNDTQFNRQAKDVEKKAKKTFTGLTSFISNFLANVATNVLNNVISQIGDFAKSSIDLASDLQEVENVVDTVFKSMEAEVDSFAQSAMESFGTSELVAKKYMGQLGAMAKAFGYTEEESYNLARSITGLTGDVASFYNMSHDEAFTKLKAVFTGETESLKELGIVMTQSALDAFALANGFGKTTSDMSESEKVALRYKFVLSQLSSAQGDFVRTADGWANQVRVLGLQFDELKATLGEGFITALTPTIRMLNTFVGKLQEVASGITGLIKHIMGVSEESGNLGDLSDVANDTLGATGDISDDMADTAESAEKAKKSILGFDEINKLSKESGASANTKGDIGSFDWGDTAGSLAGATSSAVNSMVDSFITKFEDLKSAIKSWASGLPKLEFNLDVKKTTTNLKKGLQNALKTISNLTSLIFTIAIQVVNDLQLDTLIEKVSGLWVSFTNLTASVTEALSPAFENFYNTGISPIVEWIGTKLADAITTVSGLFDDWAAWFDENSEKIAAFGTTLGEAANGFWTLIEPLLDAAWETFKAVLTGLSEILQEVVGYILDNQGPFVAALSAIAAAWAAWTISGLVADIGTFLINSPGLLASLGSLATSIWANVSAKIADRAETLALIGLYAKDFIVSIASTIAQKGAELAAWVASTAAKAADMAAIIAYNVAQAAYAAGSAIATAATWAFNAALTVLTSPIFLVVAAIAAVIAIVVLIIEYWDELAAAATVCWDAIVAGANAAWEGIKWVINGLISMFEAYVNGWIKGINFLVDAINSISFEVPEWVPLLGGQKIGFNIPRVPEIQLPRLAQGGFVQANQPTLAVVGDNRREGEIIAPESKISEAVARGMAQALSMLQGMGGLGEGSSTPIEIIVQIGEETIVHKIIDGINRESRRAGRIVIQA